MVLGGGCHRACLGGGVLGLPSRAVASFWTTAVSKAPIRALAGVRRQAFDL